MNRREFLRSTAALATLAERRLAVQLDSTVPEVALTFDDPTTEGQAGLTSQEINQRILSTLAGNHLESILFVCGKRVHNAAGRQLIAA